MIGITVLTGADGYVGHKIAAELLEHTDDRLVLVVRASGKDELAAKRARLERLLGPVLDRRTTIVPADLREADPLADLDTKGVTAVVHAAAVIRFNVERDLAQRTNVDGTARVCEFASRCPDLGRLAVISTLYAAGKHQGRIAEAPLGDAGFVNHYEWSKWAAEQHALAACADLPLSVLRLPTIIADDLSGTVSQYNAFHNTVKLFFYGLLSVVPGAKDTPVSVVTGSFVAAAITALLDPCKPGGVFNVCPEHKNNATVGELVDTAYTVLERDEGFRRRRILRPLYCDPESFKDLVETAEVLRKGPVKESLDSVASFGEQLFLSKEFATDALYAVWPEPVIEDPLALVESTVSQLVATRWGRNSQI
ncbi:SDR family oxidoreductase [Mycobacterium riyadhense]|uniref:Short chain dehydrogenase n=1 Tax=Mycobacterium riyadhense TaxID=486698 RepID=A0A653EST6_9MYCO|nr:SDR family oxidoreductase [Mycobacterium riyadhense]VTP00383.1 short chain dehydrogenase [Mycobacterium riyadhense]